MAWEYKVLTFGATGVLGGKIDPQGIEKELNTLGGQGWEVANATDTSWSGGGSRTFVVLLKRPRPA